MFFVGVLKPSGSGSKGIHGSESIKKGPGSATLANSNSHCLQYIFLLSVPDASAQPVHLARTVRNKMGGERLRLANQRRSLLARINPNHLHPLPAFDLRPDAGARLHMGCPRGRRSPAHAGRGHGFVSPVLLVAVASAVGDIVMGITVKVLLLFQLFSLAKPLGDRLADGLVALHAEVLEMFVPDLLLDDALQGILAWQAAAWYSRCGRQGRLKH
jgi:hypothetical protein